MAAGLLFPATIYKSKYTLIRSIAPLMTRQVTDLLNSTQVRYDKLAPSRKESPLDSGMVSVVCKTQTAAQPNDD